MDCPLAPLPLVLLGFSALPTLLLVVLQRRNGARWAFAPAPGADGAEGYRHGSDEERLRRRGRIPRVLPPRVVVLTCWMSFALGQMFLPGLVLGVVGLFAAGLGVVSIPGLMLAWNQFAPAVALYVRDRRGPSMARSVAKYTVLLNALVMLFSLAALSFAEHLTPVLAATLSYAALSLAHAHLLERSARALERSLAEHPDEELSWPAPVAYGQARASGHPARS